MKIWQAKQGRALATIVTSAIMISAVTMMGTAGVVWSQSSQTEKQADMADTVVDYMNKLNESLILLIPFQSAFALNDDSQLSVGFDFKPLTGARNNLFQDSAVDWCIHARNLANAEIAKIAINEWQKRLTDTTKKDVWKMRAHVNTLYEKMCD